MPLGGERRDNRQPRKSSPSAAPPRLTRRYRLRDRRLLIRGPISITDFISHGGSCRVTFSISVFFFLVPSFRDNFIPSSIHLPSFPVLRGGEKKRGRRWERTINVSLARDVRQFVCATERRWRDGETERKVNKRGEGGSEGGEGKSEPDELYAVEVASLSNGCDLISRGNLASYPLIVR